MENATRHDVIMAGVGGKGVLTAGLLLAQAAMDYYHSVMWFPSYQAAMRGGPCECTVILSPVEIASPILTQADSVVIMEPSQFKPFEGRLIPGGLFIAESAGLQKEAITRQDSRLVLVPAVEAALELGETQVSNFVLLGAYLELTGALPQSVVESHLEKRYTGREKSLNLNLAALRRGAHLARTGSQA
jgi:2-oxoglutarate ferredoxin oxidoreductase subunit gamma